MIRYTDNEQCGCKDRHNISYYFGDRQESLMFWIFTGSSRLSLLHR